MFTVAEISIEGRLDPELPDRKSTRLNCSHSQISYAVFCLTKKKERMGTIRERTKENLVSTVNAIIMERLRFSRAALTLNHGTAPPARTPASQRVRAATYVL